MPKLLPLIATSALLALPVLAQAKVMHDDYNRVASARVARTWSLEARTMAPQVPEQAALNPRGPTLIASAPVPDTPANRARYGQPLSHAGRMTAPIGD